MDFIYNHLQDTNNNKTLWVYEENVELFNKYTQIPTVVPKVISSIFEMKEVTTVTKKEKPKKESPLDLIIKHTLTNKIMKNEIKQKLVEFITIPEFSKAFGVKKSAEIISALTRDSWNQSIVLFISFLLNATVIYKEKSYLFNKEKNLQEITIY